MGASVGMRAISWSDGDSSTEQADSSKAATKAARAGQLGHKRIRRVKGLRKVTFARLADEFCLQLLCFAGLPGRIVSNTGPFNGLRWQPSPLKITLLDGTLACRGPFLHRDFSSSRLVRLVGGWTPPPPPSGMDFAERLGLWLSAFDAIKLQSAQQTRRSPPGRAQVAPRQALHGLEQQMQRVRAALAHAIAQDPVAWAGADAAQPGLAPFTRRHAELQRHMEQMIGPLREQARLSLASACPRLQPLAALDEVMQQVLAAREQPLLAGLPALLAQRFAQLQAAAAQALPPETQHIEPTDPAPSEPAAHTAADALQAFRQDWRQALLAELDLRLEPVAGLLAALNNEVNPSP